MNFIFLKKRKSKYRTNEKKRKDDEINALLQKKKGKAKWKKATKTTSTCTLESEVNEASKLSYTKFLGIYQNSSYGLQK